MLMKLKEKINLSFSLRLQTLLNESNIWCNIMQTKLQTSHWLVTHGLLISRYRINHTTVPSWCIPYECEKQVLLSGLSKQNCLFDELAIKTAPRYHIRVRKQVYYARAILTGVIVGP